MSAKYAFIDAEKADLETKIITGAVEAAEVPSLAMMCSWLRVSRSGFYEWRGRAVSARAARRELLACHVLAAFDAGRGTYGARRVHAILSRCDDSAVATASLKLVRSIMRELGLFACQPRAFRTTTVNDGGGRHIEDHLRRDFTADAPGAKLVGDITYIRTGKDGSTSRP